MATGQWTGVVRIVRPSARGRPCQRLSPISGAGLDPRVCDPSCTPVGIPSSGSDGEGCWGRETAGTDAHIGIEVVRVVAVPVGAARQMRFFEPGTAAQQLNDPPSSPNQAQGRGKEGCRNRKFEAPTAPGPPAKQPTSSTANSQGQTNSPRAKGPRAQEPRREPGGRRQQGRTPTAASMKAGWLLIRKAARQPRGTSNQEPPRSSL